MLMPEDRGVDEGLGRVFEPFHLVLGLGGQVGLQRLDILFNDSRDSIDDACLFPVAAVLFSHALSVYAGYLQPASDVIPLGTNRHHRIGWAAPSAIGTSARRPPGSARRAPV